jgi:large subunit ribosomal protein L7Ae
LATIKNEDKLEFSKILEAIKVMQNYMYCIFCVTIEAVFGCFNLTSTIFFLFLLFQANFNDKYDEYRKKWGGGIMGSKSQAKTKAKERLLAKEAAQRMS